MMNISIKQVQKIQKKVDNKMRPVIEKREQEEKKLKEEKHKEFLELAFKIKRKVGYLERKNPDRGGVFCVYKNEVYLLLPNEDWRKRKVINLTRKNDLLSEDVISEKDIQKIAFEDDMEFYMLSKDVVDRQRKIMNWFSENYAEVKMATVSIENRSENWAPNALMLAGVVENYSKDFPGSTPLDFIESYRSFDKWFKESLQYM